MKYAVVIPVSSDIGSDTWRQRSLQEVVEHLSGLGCRTVLGRCGTDEWCKADAVADGLRQTNADVLVISDGDVFCELTAVEDALHNAARYGWAIPHGPVHRLTATDTEWFYETGRLTAGPYVRPPYSGMPGGGLVVIRRDLYERAPFDPRFIGWGHEDESAGTAWKILAGTPKRGTVPLWHLWHEPQPKLSAAVGSRSSYELLHRYRRANTPESMTRLLKEIT